MGKVTFLIDNTSTLIVDEEKATLAVELIKHFTPNWKKMYKESLISDKGPATAESYIGALFRKLNINHEFQPYPQGSISVLEDVDTIEEQAGEPPAAESAAMPEPSEPGKAEEDGKSKPDKA